MRIVFVRHGHPNYRLDRLTERGHLHAEAAAERLKDEKIGKIYTSTCGRAVETAFHTADRIGIPREEIVYCPFMREISWGSTDGTELYRNGHPWNEADRMVLHGMDLSLPDWASREPFCHNKVVANVRAVAERADIWLSFLGYKREGKFYRVTGANDRTVAMFSHGGSSSAVLAHMLGIPFPAFCFSVCPDFTAISVIEMNGENGDLTFPRIEILNDSRHIGAMEQKEMPQN